MNIPDNATRIVMSQDGRRTMVTDSAAKAIEYLGCMPGHSVSRVDTGPISVTHATPRWQVWDDGSATLGGWVMTAPSEPWPSSLTAAAVELLDLAFGATGPEWRRRDRWHPLREAADHAVTVVETTDVSPRYTVNGQVRRGAARAEVWLKRHDIAFADGRTAVLWERGRSEYSVGDDDAWAAHDLFETETAARA